MNRLVAILTAKHICYLAALLVLYVLQTTPRLLSVFGVAPVLIIPAAVSIAMFEGELVGGVYGAFAGLLNDMGGGILFGFGGFVLTFFCALAGLAVAHLMHCNVWNAILYVLVSSLALLSLEFFFGYWIWGHEGVSVIYLRHTLPIIAYTTLTSPLVFWFVRAVHGRARA